MNIIRQLIIITFLALQILPAQFLSIQGVARDNSGMSLPNGDYSFTFGLYVAETGGSAAWEETQILAVTNGVMSANLGAVESMAGLDYNTEYWLGVSIDGNAELAPRGKLTLTPYAVMAQVDGTTNVFPQGGNVGIGTTAPVSNLDINKPATAADTYASLKLGSNNYGYIIEGGLKQDHGGVLKFSRNNPGSIEEKVRFDANGNVGIGITDPLAKLDIDGTLRINYESDATLNEHNDHSIMMKGVDHAFYMGVDTDTRTGYLQSTDWMTAQSNIALNPLGGNVGIGTTSPQAKLDVNGDVKIGGAKPFILRRYPDMGDNIYYNTGYDTTTYAAVIAGFDAGWLDYMESGAGSGIIIQMHPDPETGTWHIRGEMHSHIDHDNWKVDVLFIDRRIADMIGY